MTINQFICFTEYEEIIKYVQKDYANDSHAASVGSPKTPNLQLIT